MGNCSFTRELWRQKARPTSNAGLVALQLLLEFSVFGLNKPEMSSLIMGMHARGCFGPATLKSSLHDAPIKSELQEKKGSWTNMFKKIVCL